MSVRPIQYEDIVQPGDVIEVGEISAFKLFEEAIAHYVDPSHDRGLWAGEPSIKDSLRVPGFNGRLTDLQLLAMDNPYEELLSARERGWKFPGGGGSFVLKSGAAESLIPRYRGFTVLANGKTATGPDKQIQAELWYSPVPPKFTPSGAVRNRRGVPKDGARRTATDATPVDWLASTTEIPGQAIRRRITMPIKKEAGEGIVIGPEVRRIPLDVVRQVIEKPSPL